MRKVEKRTVYTLKHLDKMPSGKADGFLAQAAGKIVATEALVEFTEAGSPNFIWKGGVMLHGALLDRDKAIEKAKKTLAKKIKSAEKRLERLRKSLENTEVFEQTGT